MYRILLLTLVILSGCSSSNSPIKYYLLHVPEIGQLNNTKAEARPVKLVLDEWKVSEYLQQKGLPLQTSGSGVHISSQHLWAESFSEATRKYLRDKLYPQVRLIETNAESDSLHISIDINHLLTTHDGEVLIDIRYALSNGDENIRYYNFKKSYSLSEDGFEAAIVLYRLALGELAIQIKQDIRNFS